MTDLPPNVTRMIDRHGKLRYRFRRKGYKAAYLPGGPGDPLFHARYAEIASQGPLEHNSPQSPRKVAERSLDDLLARMKHSPKWLKKGSATKHGQAMVYQRFMDRIDSKGRRYGERPVSAVTFGWLDRIFGEMHETPGAANDLRKKLSALLNYAIPLGWIRENPVKHTTRFDDGAGYHSWEDAEISRYRAHHPLGSMARLALELALNTAARRGTVAGFTRDNIVGGRILTAHSKGGNTASVPMLSSTRRALEALPAAPIKHLLVTQFGKPFTPAGFGNKFREWCDEAGLPNCSIHGLRKAMSRMLAEAGASDAEGQAVTGHKKAEMFQYYRASANRETLADRALANLDSQPMANHKIGDLTD